MALDILLPVYTMRLYEVVFTALKIIQIKLCQL